jgi:hypothetical protein
MAIKKRRLMAKRAKQRRGLVAASRRRKRAPKKQRPDKQPRSTPATLAERNKPSETEGEQIWPPDWFRPEYGERAKRARQESAERDEEIAERELSIAEFVDEQRWKREWINFAETAESCARRGDPFVADEAVRSGAYDRLRDDLLAGDFEEHGKSMVRFLNPGSESKWVSRRHMTDLGEEAISLLDVVETFSPEDVRSQYLAYCWIPRRMYQRWVAKYGLPATLWFAPREGFQAESEINGTDGSLAPLARPNARRRGKKPKKLDSTKDRMLQEIRDGLRRVEDLRTMLEKELQSEYGVSRDTARRARNEVLAEFVENSISTKNK